MKTLKIRSLQGLLERAAVGISFLALSFVISSLLNPIIPSEASEQIVNSGNSLYTASISNNSNTSIDVAPSGGQQIFTVADRITYTNTCPYGFLVTMSSTSANTGLTRIANDSIEKTIPTISSGTVLTDNTWGYTVSGVDGPFHPIPALSSPDTILSTSAATTTAKNLDVIYGLKIDSGVPAGIYQGNVVYTVTVKPQCLKYSLSWDLNSGTGKTGVSYSSASYDYDTEINLQDYTPTRSGYVFTGWTNGTTTFDPTTELVNPNPNNATSITLTASWRKSTPLHSISSMQDMTPQVCADTTTPSASATTFDWDGSKAGDTNYVPRKKLRDTRDSKYYLVSKLADGNCWMSQNLAYNLSSRSNVVTSNIDGTTGTFKPTNSSQTTTGTKWEQAANVARSYRASTSEAYFRSGITKSRSATGSGDTYLWESAGNYYNWYAATAGTGTSDLLDVETTTSICPKGWRLPTTSGNRSFANLINDAYGIPYGANKPDSAKIRAAPLHFVMAGMYIYTDGATGGLGEYGYYWANRAGLGRTLGRLLWFADNVNDTNNQNEKGQGFSIRCVAI